jgi:hypothetical protein
MFRPKPPTVNKKEPSVFLTPDFFLFMPINVSHVHALMPRWSVAAAGSILSDEPFLSII